MSRGLQSGVENGPLLLQQPVSAGLCPPIELSYGRAPPRLARSHKALRLAVTLLALVILWLGAANDQKSRFGGRWHFERSKRSLPVQ